MDNQWIALWITLGIAAVLLGIELMIVLWKDRWDRTREILENI